MKLLQRVQGKGMPKPKQILHIRRVLSPVERRLFRSSIIILLIGIMWGGWDWAGKYRVVVPSVGGRYTEAVVGAPQLINPVFASVNDVDRDISRLVYSGLLRYDEEQRLLPDLAVKYQISDDKKTYTFPLKQGVLWHDGEPFTAHDVVYTIEMIQNPVVGSPLLVSFQGVTVTAIDDYTVEFTLKEPFAPFLSALTVGMLPEHAWIDVMPDRMRLAQRNIQPVGTGPFVFKKLLKDDVGNIYQYELRRNDRYHGTPAYLEELVFQFFHEYEGDDGAIQALREQHVDGISFVPYHVRDKVERKHITLHTLQLPQYSALFFNTDSPVLTKSEARTALTYAIDKGRVLRDSLKNEGHVIESPILQGFPGFQADREKTLYSVEQANTLLDALWPRVSAEEYRALRKEALLKTWQETVSSTLAIASSTPDVATTTLADPTPTIEEQLNTELHEAQTFYRKTKDGTIISLSLVTANTAEYQQIAKSVAGFWQEVGIKTDITFVEPKDFSRDVLRGRKYDVLLYGVIIGSDPDQYPFWHSTQIDFPGLNLSRYVNRTVDTILQKARETSDAEEEAKLYQQFQDAVLKDRPAVFLYTPTYTYATTDKIHGIDVTRIFHPSDRFADVTTWYMKTDTDWRKQ